jgi:hypothetical protein
MAAEGVREIWRKLRAERRLVCPWKPRTSWYGRAAVGMGVAAAATGTLAGLGYGGVAVSKWHNERSLANYRKQLEEGHALARSLAGDPKRRKEVEEAAEAYRLANLRPSERAGFDDHGYNSWHDARHWPSAIALMGQAAMFAAASRAGFWGARTLAKTLCEQGIISASSGGMAIIAGGLGLRAVDNAYAFFCKHGAAPEAAKAARLRHQDSFLRTSPALRFPLADYRFA